jgi:signal transduction histidine kinase
VKRWSADTLFKRLFVLMWVALVGSHVAAYLVATRQLEPGGPAGALPTFPSLPPTPGLPKHPRAGNPPRDRPPPPDSPFGEPHKPPREARSGNDRPPPPAPREGGNGLPAGALLLDYGVRLLLIGLAAWWGARWLSSPMRRLVGASRALGAALGKSAPLPQLDDRHGTVEVRETARVFNEMANQLHDAFKGRGLLMAAISHDLRTPLTRMRMRLESLNHEAAAQRCIGDIAEMNQLIDSVTEVFRSASQSEAPQPTHIGALVQSLADDLVEQGQPVAFSGEAVTAMAQPAALRRVVSNLIANAVRYGERAEVRVAAHGGQVSITIDDAGPGIPPHQLEAVFQPFYRVESSRSRHTGGTGLGLFIARDLTQRQGGTLTLSNRPEGGLRAELLLPSQR